MNRRPEHQLYFGYELSKIKFKSALARTQLGAAWIFIPFFLHLLAIGVIFTFVWNDASFLPYFTFSYLLWRSFIDPVNELAHLWRANVDPMWNAGSSPLLILSSEVLASLYKLMLFFLATVVFSYLFLEYRPRSLSGYFLAVVTLRILGVAVGLIWSFCTAKYFDLTETTSIIVLIAYLVSPVFWKPERISPENGWALFLNPVFHLMEFGRSFVFSASHDLYGLGNFLLLFFLTLFFALVFYLKMSRKVVLWVI